MKTILLYGELGRLFGKVHRREVKTVGEAVRALNVTLPGFRKALSTGGYFRVLLGGRQAIDGSQVHHPCSDKETIRIVPVIQGAGGAGRIIFGAALVGLSIMIPTSIPFIEGALATGISVGTMSSVVSAVGYSLLINGVASMLFKPPKAQQANAADKKTSFLINGVVNTVAQGNPVPVLYGRVIAGSQVASAGLRTYEVPV